MLRIEEIAKAKKIGITELANRLNVTRQTVYYYINQDDKNPLYQLQKLATALEVPLSDLFPDAPPTPPAGCVCPKCGTALKIDLQVKDI